MPRRRLRTSAQRASPIDHAGSTAPAAFATPASRWRSSNRRSALIPIAGACLALVACGDDGVASDAERFCGEAIVNRETIVAPPLESDAELAATLDFYRLMGELAPIAIADEWNDLVATLETASTLVAGDPESEQRVAMQAYATEPSAFAVKTWLLENCGLDIPITTIAPQEPVPAPTAPSSVPSTEPAGE